LRVEAWGWGETIIPRIADLFFKAAIAFLIIGIGMGLQMSISGEHNVVGAHAHTNLLGWVTMAVFGGYYALNPAKAQTRLAKIHFWTYLCSVVIMAPSLYLLYLGYGAAEVPLAIASIVAFGSIIVFAIVVFSTVDRNSNAPRRSSPAL